MEDKGELDKFVSNPVVRVYHYDCVAKTSSSYINCSTNLADIKRQVL